MRWLENAWQQLRGPNICCDWNEFFAESIDTCVRYHDRYYPIARHSHSFFEIVFLVRGNCTHHVGNDMIEMQQGDVVIVPPGTLHALYSFSDENVIFNMHISSETFRTKFPVPSHLTKHIGGILQERPSIRRRSGNHTS
ncbi:MAG: AraC family ligand binding domain-containing protein [Eubacteriales bacterium]